MSPRFHAAVIVTLFAAALSATSAYTQTSGGMIEPPKTVTTPTPLITGFTPRLAYSEDAVDAVSDVPVAADAAAGNRAPVSRMRRREGLMSIQCT